MTDCFAAFDLSVIVFVGTAFCGSMLPSAGVLPRQRSALHAPFAGGARLVCSGC